MKPKSLALCGLLLAATPLAVPMLARADSYPPQATFDLVDINGDGDISVSEWKQFIGAAASAFPAAAAACFERSRMKVFGVLDRNRDGKISWAEWKAAGARHHDANYPDCA